VYRGGSPTWRRDTRGRYSFVLTTLAELREAAVAFLPAGRAAPAPCIGAAVSVGTPGRCPVTRPNESRVEAAVAAGELRPDTLELSGSAATHWNSVLALRIRFVPAALSSGTQRAASAVPGTPHTETISTRCSIPARSAAFRV
jgi:hypothetical protein